MKYLLLILLCSGCFKQEYVQVPVVPMSIPSIEINIAEPEPEKEEYLEAPNKEAYNINEQYHGEQLKLVISFMKSHKDELIHSPYNVFQEIYNLVTVVIAAAYYNSKYNCKLQDEAKDLLFEIYDKINGLSP
jgi:hypothetical protein